MLLNAIRELKSARKELILVFIISFLVRLIWFLLIVTLNDPNGFQTKDSSDYISLADNLISMHSFGRYFDGIWYNEFFRTPLYPCFLIPFRLLSSSIHLIILFQIAMASITTSIVYFTTFKITGNKMAAFIAGLLIALDVPSILFSNFVLTETLFTFLMTLTLCCLIFFLNKSKLILLLISGISLGFATLCRPSATFLLYIILPLLFIGDKIALQKIIRPLVFILSFLMITIPWMMRNKNLSGTSIISTAGAEVFYFFTSASVNSKVNGMGIDQSRSILREKLIERLGETDIHNAWLRAKVEKQLSLEMISRYPFPFLKEISAGIISFAFKPAVRFLEKPIGLSSKNYSENNDVNKSVLNGVMNESKPLTRAAIVYQLLVLIVQWIFFFAGLIYLLIEKRYALFTLLLLSVIYFSLMVPGSFTDCRFRMPAMPLIAIAAGIGTTYILSIYRRKSATD